MKPSVMIRTAGLLVMMLPASHAADKIAIKGSNTFGEELGPQLISAFRSKNPDIVIELESKGSASGINALLDGECDIAAASRVLNEDEQRLARSKGVSLKSSVAGYYGVAVVVNEKNPLRILPDHAIRDIFTGKATNWMQVGGHDQPVEVLIRDPTGGTHLGFQELAMERLPYSTSARGFASYTELADIVAANPNAVGYVGMNLISRPGIRALAVNGIPLNDVAVNEGLYPYVRTVRMYTRSDRTTKLIEKFIRFVQSKEGQKVVATVGFVPIDQPRIFMSTEW